MLYTGGNMQGGVPGSSAGRQYDIQSESDIIALLKEVRTSTLDPSSKDEIRDLVFALQSEFNGEKLAELQMYVTPLGVILAGATTDTVEAPAAAPTRTTEPVAEATSVTVNSLGTTRPAPTFGVATPAVAATVPATPASPTPTDAEPAPVDIETAPAPVEAPAEPAPAEQSVEPSVEPAQPTPAPDTTSAADPLERIKAIKAEVNAAVGNPVNLIDTTNETGREYMNALLEAMKAVNGEGTVAPAMERLEAAFGEVQKVLAENPAPSAAPSPASTPTTEPTETPLASVPAGSGYAAAESKDEVRPEEPAAPRKPNLGPPTPPASEVNPTPPAEPITAPVDTKLQPVTAMTPPVSAAAAEAQAEAQPAPVTDSLMSEAVTTGLNQLLSEWTLFKSSGFLGTGSKGDAHPLYAELRNLPMSLVIAGRFEGATPEVRQSITDYMNGWRYEQGMTHDIQETFEHYLRRVVKIIIDKQAK